MAKDKRADQVKIATVWEIVNGELQGQYVLEPKTEDDLRTVLPKIIEACNRLLKTLDNF